MKRDQALRSLSRDHHGALVVAQKLRRGDDPAAGRELFLGFWAEHGRVHFRVEEEVLLPAWRERGPVDEALVHEMLDDHLAIRTVARRLLREPLDLEELRRLGERLNAHVRLEERRIFPLVEAALDDEALAALAAELATAEAEAEASDGGEPGPGADG